MKTIIFLIISILISSCKNEENTVIEGNSSNNKLTPETILIDNSIPNIGITILDIKGQQSSITKGDTLYLVHKFKDHFLDAVQNSELIVKSRNEKCQVWKINNEKFKIYLDPDYFDRLIHFSYSLKSEKVILGTPILDGKTNIIIDTLCQNPLDLAERAYLVL